MGVVGLSETMGEASPKAEKSRKRPLDDDDYKDEANDLVLEFSEDRAAPIRRGRKEGRRVSGVYRELKALHHIGQNASVMELVFDRMTMKDVMMAGAMNSMWYIVACRNFRKRHGRAPFLRLWTCDNPGQYLGVNWELHYHAELLSGNDQEGDEPMMENVQKTFPKSPSIQAILTLGSRHAFDLITDENAKFPFREDHIYAICQEAVITAPNFEFTDTFDRRFGVDIGVQSLFIPRSEHFTIKGFCLDYSRDSWNAGDVSGKMELPPEDLGRDQVLRATFLLKYRETAGMKSFVDVVKQTGTISILAGNPEEVGSNRIAPSEFCGAAGFSFYTGPGATVATYGIDFTKPNVDEVLLKMKAQADSAPYGFCLVVYHDGRPPIEMNKADPNTSMDWGYLEPPESMTDQVLSAVRTAMPKTPMLGINSIFPVDLHCSGEMTNMTQDSADGLTYGFLLLTYND